MKGGVRLKKIVACRHGFNVAGFCRRNASGKKWKETKLCTILPFYPVVKWVPANCCGNKTKSSGVTVRWHLVNH